MPSTNDTTNHGLVYLGYALAVIGTLITYPLLFEWATTGKYTSENSKDLTLFLTIFFGWILGALPGMWIARMGGGEEKSTTAGTLAFLALLGSCTTGVL